MKAITLDARPARWLFCKAVGRFAPRVFWSRFSNLRRQDVPEPTLPGPRWVKLRTILGGVCGTDLAAIFQRTHPASILRAFTSFPMMLGHENVARVDEVGADVTNWPVGTRVVVEPSLSCGPRGIEPPCGPCSDGLFALCKRFRGGGDLPAGTMIGLNAATAGSWAPRFLAHESQLHAVPDELTDEDAVLVDPLACSLHAVLRHPPAPGQQVLVQGAGIIGLGVVLALRALGYDQRVVCLARHPHQEERLQAAGADVVIRHTRRTPRQALFDDLAEAFGATRVSSIFGNHALVGGADVVYECVGSGLAISDAMKCAAPRATIVAVGTSQITFVDTTHLWFKELSIVGAYGRQIERWNGRELHTYRIVMDLIAAGKLNVQGLLTHVFPVSEYRRALALFAARGRSGVIKAALRHPDVPSHPPASHARPAPALA